jgi:hypothetical protein
MIFLIKIEVSNRRTRIGCSTNLNKNFQDKIFFFQKDIKQVLMKRNGRVNLIKIKIYQPRPLSPILH